MTLEYFRCLARVVHGILAHRQHLELRKLASACPAKHAAKAQAQAPLRGCWAALLDSTYLFYVLSIVVGSLIFQSAQAYLAPFHYTSRTAS